MSYRENAPVPPPCPRCDAPLFTGKVGALDAFGCGRCGGLWLDNAATTNVLRRYDLAAAELARRVDAATAEAPALSPFVATTGPCPVCTQPLRPTEHQGIKLDFCEQDGTFFDRGELARVLDLVKASMPMPMPAAPPSAPGLTVADVQAAVRRETLRQKDPLVHDLVEWVARRFFR